MSRERIDMGLQAENGEKGTRNRAARMANLELLRCVAMMMVVVLHYLGKGGLLADLSGEAMGGAGLAAWLLESFCIVAVNAYMLISGYFLCCSSFKPSRLLSLYLQVWVYSVGVGLLAVVTGICPPDELGVHYLLTLAFPVTMGHYWFMTAYVFLYLLLPLFGMAARSMGKRQMQVALALLFLVFCLLKSVLPARLEMDGQGYDCLWYLCVFLAAAYIRRFGIPFLQSGARAAGLYVAGCLAVFAELMILRQVYLRTGSLGYIMKVPTEYNHILTFAASLGLFGLFLKLRLPRGMAAFVNRIAPYTLGVYLLHENTGVRYQWQKWLGAGRIDSVPGLFLWTAAAVVCVFAVGVLVDAVRACLMRGLHRALLGVKPYRYAADKVAELDGLFQVK